MRICEISEPIQRIYPRSGGLEELFWGTQHYVFIPEKIFIPEKG